MQVICLEEEAFYELIERVVDRIGHKEEAPKKWIDGAECMKLLNIRSVSTMQSLRDNGKLRYTQPSKKVILYDRASIDEYLEKNAKETF